MVILNNNHLDMDNLHLDMDNSLLDMDMDIHHLNNKDQPLFILIMMMMTELLVNIVEETPIISPEEKSDVLLVHGVSAYW